MVKRTVAGIDAPSVANASELRLFVLRVYEAVAYNYLAAAGALGVTPATVWKLLNDRQTDSQIIRERWEIRKTPKRPRVHMPTNNLGKAIKVLQRHYPNVEVIIHEQGSANSKRRAAPILE
jgi:hypothetical protein